MCYQLQVSSVLSCVSRCPFITVCVCVCKEVYKNAWILRKHAFTQQDVTVSATFTVMQSVFKRLYLSHTHTCTHIYFLQHKALPRLLGLSVAFCCAPAAVPTFSFLHIASENCLHLLHQMEDIHTWFDHGHGGQRMDTIPAFILFPYCAFEKVTINKCSPLNPATSLTKQFLKQGKDFL